MSDLGNRQVFSSNLRRIMNERNLERSDVCNALGFKYSTFTDWYNGNKYPRIDSIEKLADYFGIQKSDLIEIKGQHTELEEYLEELRTRPEMKMLFSLAKDATKEDVEKAVKIIETLLGKE